jgi:hypothetical protein
MVSPAGYFVAIFVLSLVAAVIFHFARRAMGVNAGFRDEAVPQKTQTQRPTQYPTKAKQACATRPFGQGRRRDDPRPTIGSEANDWQDSIDSIEGDSIEGNRRRRRSVLRLRDNADEQRRQELSSIIGLMASRLDERAAREGRTGADKHELSLEEPGPVLYVHRNTLSEHVV